MSQPPADELKQTPLNARHLASGARMVPYAGWSMPIEYGGLTVEHLAIRTHAGLSDLSHMGQIEIAGPDALAALQWVTCTDVSRLRIGEAHDSALATPEGTCIDLLRVNRLGDNHFLLVVNAASVSRDVVWIAEQVRFRGSKAAVLDTSARYAVVALQGPLAGRILQPLANFDLSTLGECCFAHGEVASARATVSRTGATGEDGYEVFVPPATAVRLWDALLSEGRADGLVPAGLGALDTLRLEAGLRLHGQDVDDTTTLLEAGLGSIVAWSKGDFVGRAALERQQHAGPARLLAGFEMIDQAVASPGCRVCVDGSAVGLVTSGTQTPSLTRAIGMAYLPADRAAVGAEFDIDIRGRMQRARVVPLPFYTRARG